MTTWPRTGMYKEFKLGKPLSFARPFHGMFTEAPADFLQFLRESYAQPFVGITVDGRPRRGLYHTEPSGISTQPIVDAALRFLDCVDQLDFRAYVQQPFDSWHRRSWFNAAPLWMPAGILLDDLRPEQQKAALDVAEQCLSPSGYMLLRKSMLVNQAMGEIFNFYTDTFREMTVWFTIFGEPSTEQPWGWQMLGTHIDINCTVVGDNMSLEPLFFGAEMTEIDQGRYVGLTVYHAEENAGVVLGRSLTGSQRSKAIIFPSMCSADLPPELGGPIDGRHIGGAGRDNQIVPYAGVCAHDFSHEQRALLVDLIEVYLSRLPYERQRIRRREILEHLDETYVGWIGDPTTVPFYYRVHSPTLWIEFDHHPGLMLEDAEDPIRYHVHTIFRSPNGGDYGNALVEDYRQRSTEA